MSDGSDCSVRSYNINHDCDTSERLCVHTNTKDSRQWQKCRKYATINLTITRSDHIHPKIRS